MVTDMHHPDDALCFFQRNGWYIMRFVFALLFALLISAESSASADTQHEVQSALSKNPDLKSWMAQGGDLADIAIVIDDKLSADPEWRDKPLSERFQEVERLTRIKYWDEITSKSSSDATTRHTTKKYNEFDDYWEQRVKDEASKQKQQKSSVSSGVIAEKAIISGLSVAFIIIVLRTYKQLKSRLMSMDSNKKVFNVLLLAFILMSIIPPWKYEVDWGRAKKESPAGYSFILTPPTPTANVSRTSVSIDFNRLLIQWAALGGIAALLVINRREES